MVVVHEKHLAVVRRVGRLRVRPGGVGLRRAVEPLPRGQIIERRARRGGEAVKERLVHKQDLRALGHRQHGQMPAYLPLGKKRGDEIIQLRVREIVPVVDEDVRIRQCQHGLGIGHEHIRQRRRAGLAVSRGEHRLVDGVRIRDAADLHADVLRAADGLVERVDEVVERGLGLAAVDVPDRHGHGLLLLTAAGAAEREQQRQQQDCHARILFHAGDTSLQGALIQYNEFFPPRQPEFPAFLRALDSGVHAQYAGGGGNDRKFYIQETLFETDKNIGACALTGRPANPHTPRLPAQECLWEEPMKHENKRQQYQAGYYKTHPCRDSFPCRVCGRLVTPEGAGSSHRNHCPNCLYSLHVDITPGDRAADCGGIMEPVAVWVRKNGEWALIHRCRRCGALSANRVAADDNPMKLMSIALRPLCAPPFPLERIEELAACMDGDSRLP